MSAPLVAGIEAGGTKFVCALHDGRRLSARERIPTTAPGPTLAAVRVWLDRAQREAGRPIAAVGIASFGPLDFARGALARTPKPGWSHAPIAQEIGEGLEVPVAIDTDVNAAALAEHRWGAGRGLDPLAYVTLGTGIGMGAVVNGATLRGAPHPEAGHLPLARVAGDAFAGACPFHGACWEGLCSGPALRARWGAPAEELPADHPAWALQARYVAAGLASIAYTLSPRRIIVGGSGTAAGGCGREEFFRRVRRAFAEVVGGYLAAPELDDLDAYLVPPALGDDAGVLGAIALAQDAAAADASQPLVEKR